MSWIRNKRLRLPSCSIKITTAIAITGDDSGGSGGDDCDDDDNDGKWWRYSKWAFVIQPECAMPFFYNDFILFPCRRRRKTNENKNKLHGLFIFPFNKIMNALWLCYKLLMCLNAISHVFHFESNQKPLAKIIISEHFVFSLLLNEHWSGGIRHRVPFETKKIENTHQWLRVCECVLYIFLIDMVEVLNL